MNGQRYRYMDSLRALLIVGGVFYHAALAYSPNAHWIVEDPSGMRIFDFISGSLHVFRMPAFFFIAGFFCAMSFSQRDVNVALRRRLISFGVPLVCLALLVQPIQYLLELHAHGKSAHDVLDFGLVYFATGKYVSHLWFLLNLIVYYVVCWVFVSAARSRQPGSAANQPRMKHDWVRSKFLLAMLSCLFTLAVNAIINRIDHSIMVVLDDLPLYFPFFLAGYVGFVSKDVLDRLSGPEWSDWAIAATLLLAHHLVVVQNPKLASLLELMLWYAEAWLLSMLAVYLARRYLDVENILLRKVSEASYTIYLFHHIVVGTLVSVFAGVAMTGGHVTKYIAVVCCSVLFTYALHHQLVARKPLLKAMFNGNLDHFRPMKRFQRPAQPVVRPST